MVRISISAAAYEAVAATLPFGSVGVERDPDTKGERHIWLTLVSGEAWPPRDDGS
jgi:hypothetical protein